MGKHLQYISCLAFLFYPVFSSSAPVIAIENGYVNANANSLAYGGYDFENDSLPFIMTISAIDTTASAIAAFDVTATNNQTLFNLEFDLAFDGSYENEVPGINDGWAELVVLMSFTPQIDSTYTLSGTTIYSFTNGGGGIHSTAYLQKTSLPYDTPFGESKTSVFNSDATGSFTWGEIGEGGIQSFGDAGAAPIDGSDYVSGSLNGYLEAAEEYRLWILMDIDESIYAPDLTSANSIASANGSFTLLIEPIVVPLPSSIYLFLFTVPGILALSKRQKRSL